MIKYIIYYTILIIYLMLNYKTRDIDVYGLYHEFE